MQSIQELKKEIHHRRRVDISDAIRTLRARTMDCGDGVSFLDYNYCADLLQPYVEEVDECLERALESGAISRGQYELLYARFVE